MSMVSVTRFRTHCPTCGPVAVDPAGLTLVIDESDGMTRYAFSCDACRARVTADADAPTAELLLGLGVTLAAARPTTTPVTPAEPPTPRSEGTVR